MRRPALYALGNGTITGTRTIEKVGTDSKRQSATRDGCLRHADQDLNDDGKTRCFDVGFDLLFVTLGVKEGKLPSLLASRRVANWLMPSRTN